MTIEDLICKSVEENLSPARYEIVNESFRHKGHAGDNGTGQTHFKLTVVSPFFEGKGRVERQRIVNVHMKEAFSQGLHALSMTLLSPSEEL